MKLKGLGFSLLVCLVGCAGARTSSTSPEATAATTQPQAEASERAAVNEALDLYAAEQYDAAADAFQRAYAEDPDNSLLFARAQSLRLAGQCDQARVLYEQYLASATDPTEHNAVQTLIDGCKPPSSPVEQDHVAAR